MTMAAKTGLLMLVRVIHMAALPSALAGGRGVRGLHRRRCPGLEARDARAHDVDSLLEAAAHFHEPLLRLGEAHLHQATRDLAAFDGEDVKLPRLLADRRRRHDGAPARLVEDDLALGEHAALERAVAIGD